MAKSHTKIKRGPQKDISAADDYGTVKPVNQHLSKKLNEQAQWNSDTGKRSIISFKRGNGSPFTDYRFIVPAGGSISSGPLRPGVNIGDEFKYKVTGEKGSNDPIIIIDD